LRPIVGGSLVLAVLALTLAAAPRAFAAFPGQNGQIAFASDRDGNNDLDSLELARQLTLSW
jgi:hypothetical protein